MNFFTQKNIETTVEKTVNIESFNNEINSLHNLTNQYNKRIQNLNHRIKQNQNRINTLRKQIAEYYENKINALLQDKSITVITLLKSVFLDKNNLITINSSYPGFSFRLSDHYLLSDYYDHIEELNNVVEKFIKAINNNDKVFEFPTIK